MFKVYDIFRYIDVIIKYTVEVTIQSWPELFIFPLPLLYIVHDNSVYNN